MAKLRENNRQLELVAIAVDELIAMVEVELRTQQKERLKMSAPYTQINTDRFIGLLRYPLTIKNGSVYLFF